MDRIRFIYKFMLKMLRILNVKNTKLSVMLRILTVFAA